MRRLLVCVLALLACASLAIALWRGPHEEPVTVEVVNSSYALTGTQNVAAVADRVAVVQVVSELADLTMQGVPATTFQVRTLDTMKGTLADEFVVTQLGGHDEQRRKLVLVADDTRLQPGTVALLAMVDLPGHHLAIPVGGTRILPVLQAGAETWRSSPAVSSMAAALAQLPSASQGSLRPGLRMTVR